MAIQTSIKKSFVYWNLLYFVLCAGLGAWGAYDYWVSIPGKEEAVERYNTLMEEFAGLEVRGQYAQLAAKRANQAITEDELAALQELESTLREQGVSGPPRPLGTTEKARYSEIKEILTEEFENTQPEPPASYDRWVNLWVYVVGTGILGAPYFAWKLFSRRGKVWILEDDGTLVAPEGSFAKDQIEDIDMSIWMKKSIAKVVIKDRPEPVVLDDYEYQDAVKIVGALAHEFHPDEWTIEAKLVKEGDAKDSTDDDAAGETVAEADDSEASDPPSEGDRQA